MIFGLLLAAAGVFVEVPPEPILLVVLAAPATTVPDLLETADRKFQEFAHVQVVSPEQSGVSSADFAACAVEVRSSCWVKTASAKTGARARILMIVSLQPDPHGHAVALAAFDLNESLRIIQDAESSEESERAIWDHATKLPRETIALPQLSEYFQNTTLVDFLKRVAPKEKFGSIVVDNISAGAEVELDGKYLGVASAESINIERVTSGTRRVRIKNTSGDTAELPAEVRGGTSIHLDFRRDISRALSPAVKLGLGAVGLVSGSVLIIAGAANGPTGAICLQRSGNVDCAGSAPAFQQGPGGVAIAGGDRGPSAAIVTGAGLLGAGAVWSLGAWLFDDVSPWWTAFASILAGAATSSATYLLLGH